MTIERLDGKRPYRVIEQSAARKLPTPMPTESMYFVRLVLDDIWNGEVVTCYLPVIILNEVMKSVGDLTGQRFHIHASYLTMFAVDPQLWARAAEEGDPT